MALPSNPQTLANYDITKGDQAKIFVKKVSDLFLSIAQTLTPAGLAAILNGSGLLQTGALQVKSVYLGTITTNQTIECVGASSVSIYGGVSTAFSPTLTLAHLSLGVPVTIAFGNTSGGNITLKVAVTQPGGTAYTDVLWKLSTGQVDMTATGVVVSTGTNVIAAGAAVPLTNWYLLMVAN